MEYNVKRGDIVAPLVLGYNNARMQFTKTPLDGVILIEPQVFGDDRGYFYESYSKKKFIEAGITEEFVQDNQSFSERGTIRGLHFQKPPFSQSKLVRAITGEIYDVVVDLRTSSATFGQWFGVYLTEENKKMLYVPIGFAHGFCVTSETALFAYKCGNYYSKADELGIHYNDTQLNIDWPIAKDEVKISEKDLTLPSFAEVEKTHF